MFFAAIFGRKIGLQATFSAAQTLTASCTNLMHRTFGHIKMWMVFAAVVPILAFFESTLDLHKFKNFGRPALRYIWIYADEQSSYIQIYPNYPLLVISNLLVVMPSDILTNFTLFGNICIFCCCKNYCSISRQSLTRAAFIMSSPCRTRWQSNHLTSFICNLTSYIICNPHLVKTLPRVNLI